MIPTSASEYHHLMEPIDERILDAALEAVTDGNATMDEIARRAGVGRVTPFRRFGSKDTLMATLYAREVQRFLAHVDAALSEVEDPADRIAEAFVACVREGARHPLLATVPRGQLLEALAQGPLEVGRRFVADRLEPGQDAQADLLVRLALTYGRIPGDLDDDESARAFARAYLAPIATASATSASPSA
jgi:AcrR family transcriptional regulator